MRIIRFCLVVVGLYVPWQVMPTGAYPTHRPNEFDAEFTLQHNQLSQNEPIVLLFSARNRGVDRITLTLGIDNSQFFSFTLTDPDGKGIRSTPLRTEGFSGGTGKAVLEPGQTYTQAILLNQWFAFSAVGTYFIKPELTTGAETRKGNVIPILGETIRLQVTPRSPAQIERTCDDLEKQIESAPSAQSAQEPALFLSFTTDPICVPYLARALHDRKLVERRAIEGLERIANPEAVEVLKSALDDHYGDIATAARDALVRMQSSAIDATVKREIHEILAGAKPQ